MANTPYLTITPNVIPVDEYVAFDKTFVIKFTPDASVIPTPTYDYKFVLVYSDNTGLVQLPKHLKLSVVKETLNNASFKISGVFEDVFDRSIKFTNVDATRGTVDRFNKVPLTFGGIHGYSGPTDSIKTFTYYVKMVPVASNSLNTVDFYPITFAVRSNWVVANQKFAAAVKQGEWYKNAIAKGIA